MANGTSPLINTIDTALYIEDTWDISRVSWLMMSTVYLMLGLLMTQNPITFPLPSAPDYLYLGLHIG